LAPFVEIQGDRFIYDNPSAPASAKDGSVIADLFVIFETPDGVATRSIPMPRVRRTQVFVQVPQSVAIGTAKVYVKRPQYLSNNGAWDQLVGKESNRVQLSYDARYIFGGLSGNQLLVIDSQSKYLAARIPIGGDYPAPRSVAISPDNTRAYATLRFESAVAVIDTVALQQLDADGNLANGVSNIELLPGARPFWIAVSKNGNKAYVSDEVAGRIYVLDIDPSSGSYNKLVRTLDVGPAPSGLRGMAINANGTRLFVAAPEKMLFGSGSGDGRVFVIDVAEGSETYGEIVEVLLAGGEPYGVSATNDANVMLYTNRLSDAKGVVIVKGDVGSYTQTAVGMHLGSPHRLLRRQQCDLRGALEGRRVRFRLGLQRFHSGQSVARPELRSLPSGGRQRRHHPRPAGCGADAGRGNPPGADVLARQSGPLAGRRHSLRRLPRPAGGDGLRRAGDDRRGQ
jgi:DNA-binding beta-propeller fold protein YncE